MKNYFALSLTGHGVAIFGVWLIALFFSKPKMSYYAVDLVSLPPSGVSAPVAPETIQTAEPVPTPPQEDDDEDRIRTPDKKAKPKPSVKKPLPPKQAIQTKPKTLPSWAQANSLSSEETGKSASSNLSDAASGSKAASTQLFPYPWYLKTISDRLDRAWRPPSEFASDTKCQISFEVSREGTVSKARVTKASGDTFFDQLALRAVMNAGSMPPLPAGFNEPVLRVHMTFEGKK